MKKAALVLSGGGSLGAAHIGALRVLEKQYEFDFLAGVSAGAVVAGAIACEKTADEISDVLRKQKLFQIAFDFAKGDYGLLRGEKILKVLKEFLNNKTFEDIQDKTLQLGATDFSTGERVILGSGPLAESIRASLSVPLVFEPYELGGRWLVDGGLSQNFPLDLAIEEYTGDTIIAIDVGTSFEHNKNFSESEFFGKAKKVRKMLERTFRIFYLHQQKFDPDPRVQIIRPDLTEFTTLNIYKLSQIEAAGEEAAKQFLK